MVETLGQVNLIYPDSDLLASPSVDCLNSTRPESAAVVLGRVEEFSGPGKGSVGMQGHISNLPVLPRRICPDLAIASTDWYSTTREGKHEIRLRHRRRRLRRQHPAARISEDPGVSVLLLEAGPDYPEFQHLPEDLKFGYGTGGNDPPLRTFAGHPISLLDSRHSWQYAARATEMYPDMPVPRGKVTGGSSAINSSAFYRGDPEDFDHWAALGNDHWSFLEVLPYFRKIETDVDLHDDFHGTDGPIFVHHSRREDWHPTQEAFYNACRAAGFPDCPDHNSPGATGVGPGITNNHNRVRFSTALGYLEPSRHRLNLTIRSQLRRAPAAFPGEPGYRRSGRERR